jgi:NADH-quinone oxidoreductase subunit D
MDRLDYVSMMCNEHAYVLAIEKLLGIEVPLRAQYIRVMFDEITRILNHLMWLGAHALDVGAMGPFLYASASAKTCSTATKRCRARACTRPTTVRAASTATCRTACRSTRHRSSATPRPSQAERNRQGSLLDFIEDFTNRFPTYVDEYETLLTDNRIWKQRTVGIGVVSPEDALRWASPAPCCAARASPGTCARSSPTKCTT